MSGHNDFYGAHTTFRAGLYGHHHQLCGQDSPGLHTPCGLSCQDNWHKRYNDRLQWSGSKPPKPFPDQRQYRPGNRWHRDYHRFNERRDKHIMVSIFAEMQANATNVLRIKSVDPRKFCRKSKVWAFDFSLLVLIAQGSVEHELVACRLQKFLYTVSESWSSVKLLYSQLMLPGTAQRYRL